MNYNIIIDDITEMVGHADEIIAYVFERGHHDADFDEFYDELVTELDELGNELVKCTWNEMGGWDVYRLDAVRIAKQGIIYPVLFLSDCKTVDDIDDLPADLKDAINEVYSHIGYSMNAVRDIPNTVLNDIVHDYLSEIEHDGINYVWYLDDNYDVAYEVGTNEYVEDPARFFGLV